MTLASVRQVIVFAWQSLWRNIWLSIVTISIIILAFISINVLITLNIVMDTAITIVKDRVDVSVYFKQEATEPQVLEVQTYINSLSQVAGSEYISQQQVLQNFRLRHQFDRVIIESLEELNENPLGAVVVVKANDITTYPDILKALDDSRYAALIADKSYDDNQSYIASIERISENINKIGLITTAIFILITALIVFNTIRVAIYTHREEINIMKLVGATNAFIRSPFLFESISYAFIAVALGLLILYPLLQFAQPYINSFFLNEEFDVLRYFTGNFWKIFGLELLLMILLNVISSSIAIRRYLNK